MTTINAIKFVQITWLILVTSFVNMAAAQEAIDPASRQREKVGTSRSQTNTAGSSGAGIEVSKTAFVDGENVCGAIRITNVGGQLATISKIVDSLEVHFPRDGSSSLPAGSTKTWYKVVDVPIPLPSAIAPGKTATINYCFSLCLASDAPGANSMRNVVTVFVGAKSFTTRSVSFPPPSLDCRACCVPDGSCADTLPGTCAAAGGTARETGTDCATTQCCTPTGVSGHCTQTAPCCDSNARCQVDGRCCLPSGATGCSGDEECCNFLDGARCNAGTCCLPPSNAPALVGCLDASECCAGSCHSFGPGFTGCCYELGDSGCSADEQCCNFFDGATCNAGTCCLPTSNGLGPKGCDIDTDCCAGTCHTFGIDNHGCCFELSVAGCSADGDCCNFFDGATCAAGTCCFAPSGTDLVRCQEDTDCCAGICRGTRSGVNRDSLCCLELGPAGCSANEQCCNFFDGATCNAGTCCLPFSHGDGPHVCQRDADCCAGTCHPFAPDNHGCCFELGATATGCSADTDCCNFFNGAACNSARCCLPFENRVDCRGDSDCCAGVCNVGKCCIPQFRSGCTQDADCCPGLMCTNGVCEGVFLP